MDKLRLDLAALEVERLDIAVPGLNGGLEAFGMGHASTELGQSCEGACGVDQGACSEGNEGASCTEEQCDCDD